MLRYAVLCLTGAVISSYAHPDPPQWHSYTMDCLATDLLENQQTPFKIWFDVKHDRSRADFYGGMNKYFYFGITDDNEYGEIDMVVPVSRDDELNKPTCYSIPGSYYYTGDNWSPLPDMQVFFKYCGIHKLNGVDAEMWTIFFDDDGNKDIDVTLNYTIWVTHENRAHQKPIRSLMTFINVKTSECMLQYSIDFSNFERKDIDPEVFEIDSSTPCNNDMGDTPPYIPFMDMFNPMPSMQKSYFEHHFNNFKEKHGKEYDSGLEHFERMKIFDRNWRYIDEHNRGGHGYTLGLNHFADRTDEELAAMHGLRHSDYFPSGQPFPYSASEVEELSEDLPEQWDWSVQGGVTYVKNQLDCGSCWAFSAVGAVEGALFVHKNGTKERISLSEQAVIDCAWGTGNLSNFGCAGGFPTYALDYIKKYGLPNDIDYGGYIGTDAYCHRNEVKVETKITGWVDVPPRDENALRLAIFKHGPVSVCISVVSLEFIFYLSGVFYDKLWELRRYPVNHAVVVVGYGILNGQKYWLVKNSWGRYWGNNGYILMASRDNNCLLQDMPVYVTFD